ncbi:MAG: hypothetical protein J5836_00325, partial [Clostridia bacterium]|nr:hypothetical protein [Clostridia bacterium]
MKKSLLKIASVCIAAVLSLGAFASCGLFEVDSDRDMAQKVATVQINKTVDATDIYKKDLISGYVSYGYNYVQNYSYTTSEAYKLVLDNLVNSAVIVQQSRYEIANNYAAEEKYASALPSLDERAALLNNL